MNWNWEIEYTTFHVKLNLVEQLVQFSAGENRPGVPAYAQGGGGYDLTFEDFLEKVDQGKNPIGASPELLTEITAKVRALHREDAIQNSIDLETISVPRKDLKNIRRMLTSRDPDVVKMAISMVEMFCEDDPDWALQVVQDLQLEFNAIISPGWLLRCKHQYAILLWWLGLQSKLGRPSKQSKLWINRKPLAFVHPNIGHLTTLAELWLDLGMGTDGHLPSELPETIGKMAQLNRLTLNVKTLERLPTHIGDLQSLQHLHVRSAALLKFPPDILRLRTLQSLVLHESQCTQIPPGIAKLTQLKSILMQSGQLSTIPAEIGQLSQLLELDLSYNSLQHLPETIGNLKQLQQLNLTRNNLTALPKNLGQCPLIKLNVQRNPLTSLPVGLTALSLDGAQWTRLSESVLEMRSLRRLRVENPQDIPSDIGNLTRLQYLSLHRSSCTKIPESLGNLTQLEELDLTNIQATALPESMQQLTKLKKVWLYGAKKRLASTFRAWFPKINIV